MSQFETNGFEGTVENYFQGVETTRFQHGVELMSTCTALTEVGEEDRAVLDLESVPGEKNDRREEDVEELRADCKRGRKKS